MMLSKSLTINISNQCRMIFPENTRQESPIMITGKRNNVVMLSEDDWNAIEETLFLNSIPGMASSIKEAMDAPDSEFSEDIEW